MNKIESIKVKMIHDEAPDTSCIGEYTDDVENGVIVRSMGEFYEKLPAEMERDLDGKFLCKGEPDIPTMGREYRFFKPYAGGEEKGTKDYYTYGRQDFKRMEGLLKGDWHFVGIMAEAEVLSPIEGMKDNFRVETLSSGGLWGIESDSGDYLKEVAQEISDITTSVTSMVSVAPLSWGGSTCGRCGSPWPWPSSTGETAKICPKCGCCFRI